MSLVIEQHSMRNPRAVLHWYAYGQKTRSRSKHGTNGRLVGKALGQRYEVVPR